MITFVRTLVAMPGRVFDVLTQAKEIAGLAKQVTGVEIAVGTSFGGSISEIAMISRFDSLAQMEAANDKMMADANVRAGMRKFEGLLVPGTSRDHVWRHV